MVWSTGTCRRGGWETDYQCQEAAKQGGLQGILEYWRTPACMLRWGSACS
jgi:hypothetical protein